MTQSSNSAASLVRHNRFGIGLLCSAILLLLVSAPARAVTVDGVVNPGEYDNSVQIFFQLQNGSPVGTPGTLAWSVDASGNVFAGFIQPLSINDNTYGTNAIGWGKTKHSFSNLTGSDKAQFDFTNGLGQKLYYTVDYLSSAKVPSGFASLGVTGGDGSVGKSSVKGAPAGGGVAGDVLAFGTSLAYNFNTLGFSSFTTNSPATTPVGLNPNGTINYALGYNDPASAPGWVFPIEYEIEIAASAFGPSGFGGVFVPFAHDSPSKFGENTIIVIPEPSTTALIIGAGVLGVLYRARRRLL